jgi:hypothetical protein
LLGDEIVHLRVGDCDAQVVHILEDNQIINHRRQRIGRHIRTFDIFQFELCILDPLQDLGLLVG